MAEIQGGLLDVGLDYKGLFADPEFVATIRKQSELFAKYLKTPLNFDDPIIAGIEKQIENWLASFKTASGGGLVVGAMATTPVESANAVAALAHLGTFDAAIVSKVKSHPKVLEVISGRSAEQQAKILNSEWLDKVIGWVTTYGPVIAKLLMFLIPLL